MSTNPDRSRLSRSEDTTDERRVQVPDRHHPNCSGLAPHSALFGPTLMRSTGPGVELKDPRVPAGPYAILISLS